jgi:hypothetical protein
MVIWTILWFCDISNKNRIGEVKMERTFIVTIKENNIDCNEIKKLTKSKEFIIDDTGKFVMKKYNFTQLIEKIIFPLMCFAYIVLMFVGVINPSHPLALFMGLFSFFLAICYSDYCSKKLIEALKLKIKKSDYKTWLWAYTVIFTLISFVISLLVRYKCDIPFISDENVSNLLTWFSIIVFAYDKSHEAN